jgi:Rod binding domain-containing protein
MTSLASVPVGLMTPAATATSAAALAGKAGAMTPQAEAAKRAAIAKTAKDFEASFISSMLGNMFEGVEASAPFGGGSSETAFRSFLMDAFAKQMTKAGGIGVASSVQKEMLKLQGLS